MPKRLPGETQNQFMKRCVPKVLAEGTAKTNAQAVAVCLSMWTDEKTIDWQKLIVLVLPLSPTKSPLVQEDEVG